MAVQIYEIPDSVTALFQEVQENEGNMSYRIINYENGMDMDNVQSMAHFVENVGISDDFIEEDSGTQLTLKHPSFPKRIVIDSGGLGDFYSHGFDCYFHEDDLHI